MAVNSPGEEPFQRLHKGDDEAITHIGRSVLIAVLIGWPCEIV